MVDGIQGNRPIANIKAAGVEVQKNTLKNKLGVFGFGTTKDVLSSNSLAQLTAKFNFEPPVYKKGVAQLIINDADYIPDKPFREDAFCEV